jgi:hypothetical protein
MASETHIFLPARSNDEELGSVLENEDPLSSRKVLAPKKHRCMVLVVFLYVGLVALLFVWIRYLNQPSDGDGFADIADGLLIVFSIGSVAVLVSIGLLIVTVSGWSKLSHAIRAIGLFPMASTITIIVVLALLVSSESKDAVNYVCPDGDGCPVPKNETGAR